MSRIGQKPIEIPSGVEVSINGTTVTVKGGQGELSYTAPGVVKVEVKEKEIVVTRTGKDKFARAMHGTVRSLLANMVEGVSKGFKKELEIHGVGYRAQQQGRKLTLALGFSHTIEYEPPEGVNITLKDANNLEITGADKQLVGMASARIRGFSPAEPYKGKGVQYKDEQIRRKAGKTVA